jgi:hypothetical protein
MDRDNKLRELHELLGRVFDSVRDGLRAELTPQEYERRRHEFVFHMTDWAGDMAQFMDLVGHPDGWKTQAATTFVIGFLYHVVPHLNAAGRLLLDRINDPFADQPEQHLAPNAGDAS